MLHLGYAKTCGARFLRLRRKHFGPPDAMHPLVTSFSIPGPQNTILCTLLSSAEIRRLILMRARHKFQ